MNWRQKKGLSTKAFSHQVLTQELNIHLIYIQHLISANLEYGAWEKMNQNLFLSFKIIVVEKVSM